MGLQRHCSGILPAGGSATPHPATPPRLPPAADGEVLGWEEAGCAVWDAAALPDDAAFLAQHGAPAMLPPLLEATAAKEEWRALEIGLGERAPIVVAYPGATQMLRGQLAACLGGAAAPPVPACPCAGCCPPACCL